MMLRCHWLLVLLPALWPTHLGAQPVDREALDAALGQMRDHLSALFAYEAEIVRTTEVSAETATSTAESQIHLAWERPNRVAVSHRTPEGRRGVVCDGETLVMWGDHLEEPITFEAPESLAEVEVLSLGLTSEGLAIAGLFFSEEPLEDLAQGFEAIHDLGQAHLEGRDCRLIGFQEPLGLRMVMWIDTATWLPIQVTVDASSVLRDLATAANVNNQGARVVVIERHRDVRINPTDLVFDIDAALIAHTVSEEVGEN